MVDHFVEAARREGCSWAQIGSVLGVTRQGAQQRYGGVFRGRALGPGLRRTLHRKAQVTRFGREARAAVVEAQNVARAMRHDHVDTEHLLLGIAATGSGGAGAAVLARSGLDREALESEVLAIVGPGTDVPAGRVPFAPAAKKVLELSLREAISLGNPRIGTGHLLLALLRERKGVAAGVLAGHGLDRSRVLAELESIRGDEPPAT